MVTERWRVSTGARSASVICSVRCQAMVVGFTDHSNQTLIRRPAESRGNVNTMPDPADACDAGEGCTEFRVTPSNQPPLRISDGRASVRVAVRSTRVWKTSPCLSREGVDTVVCLCGHNEDLRAELERDFAGDRRVRVEPFTDEMPDWLAAADALVHSTGGLTVLEALMRGCPAISYGWGRGHVRAHNRAFTRFGLAQVAVTPAALRAAVASALEQGRVVVDYSELPSAASFVLAEAEGSAFVQSRGG